MGLPQLQGCANARCALDVLIFVTGCVVMLCAYVMIPVRSRLAGEGHARIVLPRDVLLDVKHVTNYLLSIGAHVLHLTFIPTTATYVHMRL